MYNNNIRSKSTFSYIDILNHIIYIYISYNIRQYIIDNIP